MNAAVRAVVRMGLYVGAKVYFIHEVNTSFLMIINKSFYVQFMVHLLQNWVTSSALKYNPFKKRIYLGFISMQNSSGNESFHLGR